MNSFDSRFLGFLFAIAIVFVGWAMLTLQWLLAPTRGRGQGERGKINLILKKNKEAIAMTPERVADMTMEELKTLISQVVAEKMVDAQLPQSPKDTRSVQEVLAAMDRIRWTPPAGSPSVVEMIREDRDS
ncbi:MAG TPA: hypothetical protein V6D28_09445 [Leptolyngbyaceae cyanobacterium]